MKIFLVTDDVETRVGLRLSGVDGALVDSAQKASQALEDALKDENIGVLLITDGIRKFCPETVLKLSGLSKPVLCEIPDSHNAGHSKGALSDYIRNAVGINI